MLEVGVRNSENEVTGTLPLDEAVFGLAISKPLLHEVIQMQLASERQGTASTKTRAFVSGGGRKPWKQKGTGRARAGSNRSPIWRGGAVIFGPQPRSYAYSITKKKSRKALYTALSSKVQEGALFVVDAWPAGDLKTKTMAAFLKRANLEKQILLIVSDDWERLHRAARNLPRVKQIGLRDMNVYDVIRSDKLMISRDDLVRLQEGKRESA